MDTATLSQWQFAITSVYHFFFVPLTLGLSILVAIMETIYVRTGQEVYKRMTKFWGKLFLINFAMGVVTGIVQEFQFGMNWADYSRFVGDVFGAPLAVEALLAFFLESTFLGVWIFGWERISKGLHALAMWLVALGTNLSALWILTANSFMQSPVAYQLEGNRAVMTNFFDLLRNPYLWRQFPHTIAAGLTTAAFFVVGISVYHLLRKKEDELFQRSLKIGAIAALVAVILVGGVGHAQAQKMFTAQPMKIAAAEGVWDTEDPAGFSFFTIIDQQNRRNLVDVRVPYLLSILAYNRPSGAVIGVNQLQADFEQRFGPGNYIPNMNVLYWTFRIMVGAGLLMGFAALYLVWVSTRKHKLVADQPFMRLFPFFIALPYLANTSGWIMTEMGRQPWVVYGLMKTQNAVSPNLTPGMVLTTLIGFLLIYGLLMLVDIYLLVKYAKAGPQEEEHAPSLETVQAME